MNIYIWKDVAHLTTSWHSGGGLVVAHESLEAARALMREGARLPAECSALVDAPSSTFFAVMLANTPLQPAFWVFPDAGCC